jgi:HD-like signal output (HDOD) protein
LNLLRTVNSSYYGLPQKVSTIKQAVVMLGMREVKHIAVGCALSSSLMKMSGGGYNPMAFWRHALFAGAACRLIATEVKEPEVEEAFLTGLLKNVGALAMTVALGDAYTFILKKKWRAMEELADFERAALQVDHAEVASAMLETWKLPPVLVEPIRYAFRPQEAPEPYRRLATILALGSAAADLIIEVQAGEMDRFMASSKVFCTRADEWLGLNWCAADQLLADATAAAGKMAELFKIDAGELPDFDTLSKQFNIEVRANPAA